LKFLLDTNAISEVLKVQPDPGFMAWFTSGGLDRDLDDALHLSVITVGEVRRGALRLAAGTRRARLEAFLSETVVEYGARILSVDLAVVEAWAQLAERYRAAGVVVDLEDELIAATAHVHGLTIVTRNIRHFEHSGCELLSPWSG
jgi:predicted nucleic acid-binding protein